MLLLAAKLLLESIARKRSEGKTDAVLSPLAVEAVQRINAIFDIEREINGQSADERLAARKEKLAPLVDSLEAWMRETGVKVSRHNPIAKAIDYMLRRWDGFTLFLKDETVCLTNNAAERALRHIDMGKGGHGQAAAAIDAITDRASEALPVPKGCQRSLHHR
jgi:transposase